MLFNSLIYIVFLLVVLAVYYRLQHRRQNFFLLFASYFFYGWWDWRFLSLLLISTFVDFHIGRALDGTEAQRKRKLLLLSSVCINLGFLGFFKYFNFFVESAAEALTFFGLHPNMPLLEVLLPVGISFYTFQTMSYTIDIYRKKLKHSDNFLDFAVFVSFFPQLVAGPIERAVDLLPQIAKPRSISREQVVSGLSLMLLGYFKKVAIADSLAPIADEVFSDPASASGGLLLGGMYAFALQIYCDFSGYTNIARGTARLLGIELSLNFNAPYFSRNITEFWRRWHISLSTWLKQYLYFSLGGNRKGRLRTYLNLMITMFLGGLWHGAAWTFVFWGVLHGVYLAVHKLMLGEKKPDMGAPKDTKGYITDAVRVLITFHLVCLTWIFFRAPNITSAFDYIAGILTLTDLTAVQAPVLFSALLVFILDTVQLSARDHAWLLKTPPLLRHVVIHFMFFAVCFAAVNQMDKVTSFIYFQF